jgi:hypothetical protein
MISYQSGESGKTLLEAVEKFIMDGLGVGIRCTGAKDVGPILRSDVAAMFGVRLVMTSKN